MPPALSLHHVVRRYRAGIPGCNASIEVLRDVSLEVRAGEIVGLSGAAGSGKSTLLLCCAGRLRPDGGTISWFGAVSRSGLHPAGIAGSGNPDISDVPAKAAAIGKLLSA